MFSAVPNIFIDYFLEMDCGELAENIKVLNNLVMCGLKSSRHGMAQQLQVLSTLETEELFIM